MWPVKEDNLLKMKRKVKSMFLPEAATDTWQKCPMNMHKAHLIILHFSELPFVATSTKQDLQQLLTWSAPFYANKSFRFP